VTHFGSELSTIGLFSPDIEGSRFPTVIFPAENDQWVSRRRHQSMRRDKFSFVGACPVSKIDHP
jgi:hypothetical protein